MKILITSDNHLGYKETDVVRRDDSFNTFEEILQIAKAENVDFIIQGGDLFEDNRPSRNTYNRAVKLLKKYCLGGDRMILNSTPPLNTADNALTVSLPIMCIHGNHDDPSGFNSVSPLDILNSTGLVNYFGKCSNIAQIELTPILIEGDVKIAIYGLGYITNRAVYQAFYNGNVRVVRPEGEDWYSIFIVHQNRVAREEEYLPEDLIDPFFDLVIYGHEHESICVTCRHFDLIQCGSTVRTSLSESEIYDKYVYILEVLESAHIRRIALESVRPVIMDSIKIESEEPEIQIQNKLTEMLASVKFKGATQLQNGNYNEYKASDMSGEMLPLVRLRVEAKIGCNINKHMLNQYLADKVANPTDVLRISRKGIRRLHKPSGEGPGGAQINEIYKKLLETTALDVIPSRIINEALDNYINRDIKDSFLIAIQDCTNKIINAVDIGNIVLEDIPGLLRQTKSSLFEQQAPGQAKEGDNRGLIVDEKDVDSFCHNSGISAQGDVSKLSSDCFINTETGVLSSQQKQQAQFYTKSSNDFTFLEEKRDAEEAKVIIAELKKGISEKRKGDSISDDDLFSFKKYI